MSDTIELPQNLTIHHIEEQFNQISELMNEVGDQVVLDASKVETIDTSGLQTLLVAVKTLEEKEAEFSWESPTEILTTSAQKIGIHDALGL